MSFSDLVALCPTSLQEMGTLDSAFICVEMRFYSLSHACAQKENATLLFSALVKGRALDGIRVNFLWAVNNKCILQMETVDSMCLAEPTEKSASVVCSRGDFLHPSVY